MEKWEKIKGFESYMISNTGKLKGVNGKISFGWNVNGSYKKVRLYKDGLRKDHYMHRLVAKHFLENVDGKFYVNHKDSNPSNNNYLNLEWCTHRENIQHATSKGRMDRSGVMVKNTKTGEIFKSVKEAAESIGMVPNTLVYSLKRGSKKHPFSYLG